ncbi:hypothetical protein [Limobrevibacterium gyesilva]|nr:hypothetical protein [Limobrevibacterium gyesilva]
MALIGQGGPDTAGVVSALMARLAGSAVRVVRVANPLTSPLTLTRLILQIGGDQATSADEELAIGVRSLTVRTSDERQVVLLIEQADTLQRQALLFLQALSDLAPPRAPVLQVLFAGKSRLLTLLEGAEFSRIREQLATSVVLEGESGESGPPPAPPVPTATPAIPLNLVAASSRRRGRASARRWRRPIGALVAIAALVFAATGGTRFYRDVEESVVALLHPQSGPTAPAADDGAAAADPAPAIPAATAPSAPPTAAVAGLPPGNPAPVPAPVEPGLADHGATPSPETASANAEGESEERLRREFNTFLSRSGPGLAQLTDAQRETLFQQYLARRRTSH